MAPNVSSVYTSCACNRSPNALDWGYNGLICYGACNSIAIFEPQENTNGRIIHTLVAHTKLVTSVHWIRRNHGEFICDSASEEELISTSADKTAIIWSSNETQYLPAHTLTGHTNIVSVATAIYLQNENKDLLIATSSADSSIKIWERNDKHVECIQTISLGNGFALDVKFSMLAEPKVPVLAVGGDDAKVHIYVTDKTQKFHCVITLDGHEDWIRCLDFIHEENGNLLLASASQDCFIRIWKVSLRQECEKSDELDGIKLKELLFSTNSGHVFAVTLESVLGGHENWIYSVKWHPYQYKGESKITQPMQLLSASMDKTMIIWEPDIVSNIWFEKIRVGEVGGNTLGFYGGTYSPDGKTIIAHGYQGAVHLWHFNKESDRWLPGIAFGGHFSEVQDVDWDPNGEFLLSCSYDQTTRLHAPFYTDAKKLYWHEIARPQVHGYDMVCLAVISRYKFISGGDEKVLRIFEAPRSFAENFKNICQVDSSCYLQDMLPEGASVPALGLSNKAIFSDDLKNCDNQLQQQKHAKDQYPEFSYTPVALTAPPTEELLLQNTLWPEVQKLYGHPYEVFAVTSNHSGTIVASSCKASKAEHAAIILWNVSTWRQLGQLVFHSLTVTQLAFSPDDQYLVSVSRDRTWCLHKYSADETPPYKQVASLDKKSGVHSRIIWSCAWSHDSMHFATASRDKKVAIWSKAKETTFPESKEFTLSSSMGVEDSATAVAFSPCFTLNSRYMLAVGLENGRIILCTWCGMTEDSSAWQISFVLHNSIAHNLNVNRLKFSPVRGEAGYHDKDANILQLASCGSDYHVRVYNIEINSFS